MTRDEIYTQLEASGLAQYWPTLQPHLRPAVKISTFPATEGLPIGISRFGGEPDLLPGTEWPLTKFGKPLRFLGQFNLAETAPLGTADILPDSGILSFFHHDPAYFGDGTEEGEELYDALGVAFYFPDTGGLERANSSAPTFPQATLQLYPAITVPSPLSEMAQNTFGEDVFRYNALTMTRIDWEHHQLLGYSSSLHEEIMGADLQVNLRGLSNIERPMGTTSEQLCIEHGIQDGIKDWEVLLKLEYDENLDWYWGKGGTLFFMIRKQDLSAFKYSQVKTYNWFV